jgi:hypothetical protein
MRTFFKKHFQKWPAKVGYIKIGDGLWYECWNDNSWRPTLWTRIKLLLSKGYRNKYKR